MSKNLSLHTKSVNLVKYLFQVLFSLVCNMMKNNIDILDLKNDILNIIGDCMKQDNIND